MCDYYEMAKVFLNHIKLKENEILIADLAAGIEMIARATIMSFDLVFVVTDANFKNIKVAKQIIN
jgi:CobQ/CobB/MinD/ParA nucleotide binding domain protein